MNYGSPFGRAFGVDTRPNSQMICRLCYTKMGTGEVYITMWGTNLHRVCAKRAMEWSFDVEPLTAYEMSMDPSGRMDEVETARMMREFAEYRQELLVRYTG